MTYRKEPSGLDEAYEHLRVDDPERLLHTIYHELRRIYRVNAERYDEVIGDDGSTFGFCVYRNSWHAVEEALAQFGSGVETSRPNNSLVITTPGPLLKLYRGGVDETFDIESYDTSSGSETKQRYTAHNSHQLAFDLGLEPVETQRQAKDLDHWMIVHSGNHESGLKHVWMGAPRTSDADNPSPWAFVIHLPDLCDLRSCMHGVTRTDLEVERGNAPAARRTHAELAEPELIIERRAAEDGQ
jgi:hypothetical protein